MVKLIQMRNGWPLQLLPVLFRSESLFRDDSHNLVGNRLIGRMQIRPYGLYEEAMK